MRCAIEFEKLIDTVILPDGIRFKDFGNGVHLVPGLRPDGKYIHRVTAVLERESDKKTEFFSISFLGDTPKKFVVCALQLVEAIDDAILKLEKTTWPQTQLISQESKTPR